jgi:hypothetical protein
MVTSLPNRRNVCASSQPIGPAPITVNRRGSSRSENTVSLVRYPASARPGTGSATARPPVAMIARANSSRRPSTSMTLRETNLAWPKYTSTPSERSRSAESLRAMRACNRRMRPIAAAKSTLAEPVRTPNSAASRTASTARAARMMPFEGTQP